MEVQPLSRVTGREPAGWALFARFWAAVALLAGFGLRAAPLTQNRFHPDEALYATFGRLIASGIDPLLSGSVVDKPPLPFYLMAASMSVFGGTELAARLPFLFASIVCVALTVRLAQILYNRRAASLAGLVLAASPLAILFAPTLFTDTLLSAFLLASLALAARRRWAAAGCMFGLAFASKQTALFFAPLLLALGVAGVWLAPAGARARSLAAALRFIAPVLICIALVFGWDAARQAPISFWTQGYSDNSPGRLIRANEFWPRLAAWADLLQYPVPPAVAATAGLGLIVHLATGRPSAPAVYDYVLSGFVLAFLAGYWLLAFNIWDRYLVALAPLIALLIGRGLEHLAVIASRLRLLTPQLAFGGLCLVTALGALPPALIAAGSGYAIGGDHGAYDGIDEIAASLRAAPPGSVLYDFWLSWELGFYLFDGPVYLAWLPGPGALAEDLQAFGATSPRYIVAPSWESFAETRAAVEAAGYRAEPIKQTFRRDGSLSFTLYRLLPAAP